MTLWNELKERLPLGRTTRTPSTSILAEPLSLPDIEMHILDAAGFNAADKGQALTAGRDTTDDANHLFVRHKKLDEALIQQSLAEALQLEIVNVIEDEAIDQELVLGIPLVFLRQMHIFPFRRGSAVLAAMADPLHVEALDDVRRLLEMPSIAPVITPSEEILSAIERAHGQDSGTTDDLVDDFEDDLAANIEDATNEDLLDESSSAPVIRLVNQILAQAVKSLASDIHIEPYKSDLKIRFRLDGVLYNMHTLPKRLHAAVVSRLKIMSRLNIAEKRLPQDGRIEVRLGNRLIDLRVSIFPTAEGERIVMRLLEKNSRVLSLEELGLGPDHFAQIRRLVTLPNGVILVTGPTGSGKTTTLYAALSSINSPDKNILTIEDPVEYKLEGVGQMQVNDKIDLTFAKGLRSMVRQDPDVILVGEIRDFETAEIAIQAALTGHLVFSTLHTNDAPSAITRLIDMGIEAFLLSSSVRAIVAQRLVRVLCPHCKQAYTPSTEELHEVGLLDAIPAGTPHQAVGCPACLGTGYKGRMAIYEIMLMSETLRDLVIRSSDANAIRQAALADGMISMRQDGIRKIFAGITTFSEVLRATMV
ncbi:type II secretion system ATPase GspE [Desulfovibrio inopinatus]|uniref:type II secretion system ATPase GspE n=1 Tax=Desulfovibrio inopinatus TaxID=102109 RepID=UPI000424DC37|nr:type II secretion system ATPase GspE [Desulfovibrio inopinatus]